MLKAYCTSNRFNDEAKQIIKNAGVELTINDSREGIGKDELISALEKYDILIISIFSKLTADMIKYVKTPKIIATLSVGLDHIDESFLKSPLITVINAKTANSLSVAEHIFALILTLNKRVEEGNRLVLEGKGNRKYLHEKPEDISQKTLGLIGCGNISLNVMKIANAFNMKILCYDKYLANSINLINKGVRFVDLDELLKTSDIISVNIPLDSETKDFISKDKIRLMKSTATFINTSRTEVVDTKALIEYADLHDTFYVGLDIDVDNYKELFNKYRKNVIVTPHIAGTSKQAIYKVNIEVANRIVESLILFNADGTTKLYSSDNK